jgi:hypothetical protein
MVTAIKDSKFSASSGEQTLKFRNCFPLLWVLVFVSSISFAQSPKNIVELTDLTGQKQTPLSVPDSKVTVLFFVLPDCPISNAHAPEVNRIVDEYSKKGVASFIVYVDPDLSEADAKTHATDFGYRCPVIRDASLELVKATDVTIAPEVAVLGPDGKRLYRGRINNLYAGLGKRRAKATQNDLRDALDAILADKPVAQETTTAIGCYIPKLEKKSPSK